MSFALQFPANLLRAASCSVATAVLLSVSGCYVVPIDPRTGQPLHPHASAAAGQTAASLTARLYPANELASGFGIVNATMTNDLQGRGTFLTTINGENFSGEATRKAGSSREGSANGAGNRGGFLNCDYTMNSATLGTGTCRHHTGAVFKMHMGQ